MKRMFIVLMAGIFAALAGAPALAGEKCGKTGQSKWQEKRIERMAKDLGLTPEQKDKVAAIMKENGEKMKAEMQKMREAAKTNREAADQQIKAVLTPEQAQKFDKLQSECREKGDNKMKGCRHGKESGCK